MAKGRTAGPFSSPPFENFQVSPIGLVPKKHSDKLRTIFGEFQYKPFYWQGLFSLQYITIDNAISAIQGFGSDCFMDFDKVLPFGLRSAPSIFNQLSDALEWMLQHNCVISFVGHILDDFLITEPLAPTVPLDSLCQTSLSSMILSFKNLNIPIFSSQNRRSL